MVESFFEQNKDISDVSNFKTPAIAQRYFEISDISDLGKLFDIIVWSNKNKLEVLWISGGTNMLFAFDEFKGVVIKNSLKGWSYNQNNHILETYGAESIWDIAEKLETQYRQNLWHRFIGLPGSIAGAIYGNAGCFGLEAENNFVSCQVLDLNNGQLSTIEKKDMGFEYRSSMFKKDKKHFIISAVFDLSSKIEKYHSDVDNIDFRENKQPKGNSCGSFFKNPNKDTSAGYLIEQVGLKGYKLGGAYFSEKHANFLMHDGTGSYSDMLDLIELAQKRVKQEFNIELENEVQIITNAS